KVVNGIAANDYTHTVREDPTRKGLLYAGTQHGFYVSFDDGDHWQPFRQGLPDTPVTDVWVDANDIAITAHGRGFWVLDDIASLRQYEAGVITEAHLLQARRAHSRRRERNDRLLAENRAEKSDTRDSRPEGSGGEVVPRGTAETSAGEGCGGPISRQNARGRTR